MNSFSLNPLIKLSLQAAKPIFRAIRPIPISQIKYIYSLSLAVVLSNFPFLVHFQISCRGMRGLFLDSTLHYNVNNNHRTGGRYLHWR